MHLSIRHPLTSRTLMLGLFTLVAFGCTSDPAAEPVQPAPAAPTAAAPESPSTVKTPAAAAAAPAPEATNAGGNANIAAQAAADTTKGTVTDDGDNEIPPAPTNVGAGLTGLKDPSQGGKYLWVQQDNVPIYDKPAKGAAQVGTLQWGEKITVQAKVRGYVKIAEGQFVSRRALTDRRRRFIPHATQSAPPAAPAATASPGSPAGEAVTPTK